MKPYGVFSHNDQTFRILTKLENRYARFDGLNLTWETLEGVAKHNGPVKPEDLAPSIRAFGTQLDLEIATFSGPEAQVAALADDIAYNTHDFDDGYRAGFFRSEDLAELPLFGPALIDMRARYPDTDKERLMYETVREVIGLMVSDCLETTRRNLASARAEIGIRNPQCQTGHCQFQFRNGSQRRCPAELSASPYVSPQQGQPRLRQIAPDRKRPVPFLHGTTQLLTQCVV